jgi:hypothetical protein
MFILFSPTNLVAYVSTLVLISTLFNFNPFPTEFGSFALA